MTTPPTPADWYPDPENPAGLRYWDGIAWTEHRAPAPVAAAEPAAVDTPSEPPAAQPDEFPASEQATSVVSLPPTDQPTTAVPTRPADDPLGGSHHATSDAQQEPVQPYDTHPPTSYEPPAPDLVPWDAPLPSWDSPSSEQAPTPAPAPSSETPASETPSSGTPASAPPSYEAPSFAPPPGGPPSGPLATPGGAAGAGPNKKLVAGILGGAAAILIAIIVVITLAVVRQDEPTVTSQGTSSAKPATTSSETSTKSSSASSSAESPTPTPPPNPTEGSDGDYTFSVAGTETGDTITSTISDAVQTTADGMFYVVYVNVSNTGTAPLTFVATFQQLSAAGTTYTLDDEATAFLGGTVANVAPGDKVETPLVYDVPAGTAPDSILLRADPVSPGVTLPLQ